MKNPAGITNVVLLFTLIFSVSCSKKEMAIPNQTAQEESIVPSGKFDFRTDQEFQRRFNKANRQVHGLSRTASVDMEDIYEVYGIASVQARRQAFALLTSEEKCVFWDTLVENKINVSFLDNGQKELLHDLQASVLTIDFFEENPSGKVLRADFDEYLPEVLTQLAEAEIDNNTIRSIFIDGNFTGNPPSTELISYQQTAGYGCTCAMGSSF